MATTAASTVSKWTKHATSTTLLHTLPHHLQHRGHPLPHHGTHILSLTAHHLRKEHNLRCSSWHQHIHEMWPHFVLSQHFIFIIRQYNSLHGVRQSNLKIRLLYRFEG